MNNLKCTNYSSVRTNTRFTVVHFHRIFKNGGQRGGSSEHPLDPPLGSLVKNL